MHEEQEQIKLISGDKRGQSLSFQRGYDCERD